MLTVEPDVDTRLDFTPTLPCEGREHHLGSDGHAPFERAAYALSAPCCSFRLLICEPRATWLLNTGLVHCTSCDRDFPMRPNNLTRL